MLCSDNCHDDNNSSMIHKMITMVVASDIESLIIMVVEIVITVGNIDGNDKMISILLMLFVIEKKKKKILK